MLIYLQHNSKNGGRLHAIKGQNIIGADGKYTKEMYDCGHPSMEDFRGKELGVRAAEAFIRMTGSVVESLLFEYGSITGI